MSALTRRGFLVGLMASTALSARIWQEPASGELRLADIERVARHLKLRRVKPIRGIDGREYYVALLHPAAEIVLRRAA